MRKYGFYWAMYGGRWVTAEWRFKKTYPKGEQWVYDGRIIDASQFTKICDWRILDPEEVVKVEFGGEGAEALRKEQWLGSVSNTDEGKK